MLETEWNMVKAPFEMTYNVLTNADYRAQIGRGFQTLYTQDADTTISTLWNGMVVDPARQMRDAFVCDDPADQARALTNIYLFLGGTKSAKNAFGYGSVTDTMSQRLRGMLGDLGQKWRGRVNIPEGSLATTLDDVADGMCLNSFTPDTPVATEDGATPPGLPTTSSSDSLPIAMIAIIAAGLAVAGLMLRRRTVRN